MRAVLASLIAVLALSSAAQAQAQETALSAVEPLPAIADQIATPTAAISPVVVEKSGTGIAMKSAMASLYGATAAIQLLDATWTLQAVDNGHRYEMNPLMMKLLSNKPAFIATKAGIAAAAIYFTQRASKSGRMKAILTLAALDGFYAVVLRNNYKIANVKP